MVIPNIVMKFHNVDISYKIGYIFDLSSALACRVESINHQSNGSQSMVGDSNSRDTRGVAVRPYTCTTMHFQTDS